MQSEAIENAQHTKIFDFRCYKIFNFVNIFYASKRKEKAIEHGVFRAPKIPQKFYEFWGCKKLRFLLTSIFESYTKNQIAVDTQKQVILAQKVVKGPRHDSKDAIHTIRKTKKHKP